MTTREPTHKQVRRHCKHIRTVHACVIRPENNEKCVPCSWCFFFVCVCVWIEKETNRKLRQIIHRYTWALAPTHTYVCWLVLVLPRLLFVLSLLVVWLYVFRQLIVLYSTSTNFTRNSTHTPFSDSVLCTFAALTCFWLQQIQVAVSIFT
jgi:hypothetical protein